MKPGGNTAELGEQNPKSRSPVEKAALTNLPHFAYTALVHMHGTTQPLASVLAQASHGEHTVEIFREGPSSHLQSNRM